MKQYMQKLSKPVCIMLLTVLNLTACGNSESSQPVQEEICSEVIVMNSNEGEE